MKLVLRNLAIGLLWVGLTLSFTANAATKKATKSSAPSKPQPAKPYTVARNPYLSAMVVDAATGRILFENQPDAVAHPASVLKLMDLLIILERIQAGQLSLQDQVPVSAKAAKTGGTQVWLAQNESFSVEDMLFALMIRSANDAAVALAEKVAGSTDAFVELMNRRAQELGMRNTVFRSVHGLPPEKGQEHDVITARDLTVLCRAVLKHPEALRYTSTRVRNFRPGPKMVEMRTHNHLLAMVDGCDGLKTGYTYRAGYCVAATAQRNGQRLIAVVLGSPDYKTRDAKAAEMINKGFGALSSTTRSASPAQSARR